MRWILVILLLLMGCENAVDERANVLPSADAGAIKDVGVDAGGACGACPQVGDWYRYTKLALTSIQGREDHGAILLLNLLWKRDIEQHELNVLYEVMSVTDDEVVFRAMNGAWTGLGAHDYCQLTQTEATLRFHRDGCGLRLAEPTTINVYQGSVEVPKNCGAELRVPHAIPVGTVEMFGRFDEACTVFQEAEVPTATLAERALDEICTCLTAPGALAAQCMGHDPAYEHPRCGGCNETYTNLRELFEIVGAVELECESEDGAPALCMSVEFEMARLEVSPPRCP